MRYISDKAVIIEPCFIGDNVYIGAYSVIGPNVKIGDNCWIDSYVNIRGKCVIGVNNKFLKFSNIGQSFFNDVNKDWLLIGDNNFFSEGFMLYKNSSFFSCTTIGNNNFFMRNVLISYCCFIKDNIFISTNVSIGFNVFIDSFVILSDFVFIASNIFLGAYSFISAFNFISSNVVPYSLVHSSSIYGKLNLICLKKNFFSKSSIIRLKKIYKLMLNVNLDSKLIVSFLFSNKYISCETKLIVNFLLKKY